MLVKAFTDLLRQRSLRSILIVPFVLQLAGAVGLVWYLSLRNSQETVRDMAAQLRQEITARIDQQLKSYVDIPHSINRINSSAVLTGDLKIETATGFNQLWEQAKIFPNTNLIYCASERDGSLLGVGRNVENRGLQLVTYNPLTNHQGYIYELNSFGDRTTLQRAGTKKYDARVRPWYKAAKLKGDATWSEIYLDFDTQLPTITASLPVYDRSGRTIMGVCATDFILPAEMSVFLQSLQVGQSGETFIMDREGVLVATSTPEKLTEGTGANVRYLPARESSNPLIRGTANYLSDRFGNLNRLNQSQQLEFDLDGRQLVQVLPFNDGRGIDWLIVVVVPESDFTGRIQANTHVTTALYLLSLALAVGVGILTARWVARPLIRLNEAAKQIAQGQWHKTVEINRTDEVGELAQSFNQMASQLQSSFVVLENRNADLQQTRDDLTKAKEQLEAVLNAVPGPISWIAAEGFYLGINSYLAQSLNLPAAAIVGNPVGMVGNNSNYVDFVNAFLSSSDDSASQEISIDINGQEHYYLLAAQKYQQGMAIVVVGIDITERQQAQESLRQAQMTNQAIVSAIPDLLMRIRSNGIYQGFNFGGTTQILNQEGLQIGSSIHDLMPPDKAEERMRYVQQAIATRELQVYEYELEVAGKIQYEEARLMSLSQDEVLVMIRDMTQRKLSEAALRQSEANIRALVEAIPDLLIRVRRDGTYLDIQGRNRLVLYDGEDFLEGTSVYNSLPPVEAQRRMHYIQLTLQTGLTQVYEQQLSIGGQLQHEEVRMVVTGKDEVLMIIRNITEQKRAESALRIAEENYRGIFENALEGIFQSTPNGKYIRINPAMARIYGYSSPDEMLASVTDIKNQLYVNPEDWQEFQHRMETLGAVKSQVYQ